MIRKWREKLARMFDKPIKKEIERKKNKIKDKNFIVRSLLCCYNCTACNNCSCTVELSMNPSLV
jgi:heterodisulfide reductase subunit C